MRTLNTKILAPDLPHLSLEFIQVHITLMRKSSKCHYLCVAMKAKLFKAINLVQRVRLEQPHELLVPRKPIHKRLRHSGFMWVLNGRRVLLVTTNLSAFLFLVPYPPRAQTAARSRNQTALYLVADLMRKAKQTSVLVCHYWRSQQSSCIICVVFVFSSSRTVSGRVEGLQ